MEKMPSQPPINIMCNSGLAAHYIFSEWESQVDKRSAEDSLRALRQVPEMSKGADFALIDELENAKHLLHASIMACDAIEALDERNAIVAVIAETERRIQTCVEYLRAVSDGRY